MLVGIIERKNHLGDISTDEGMILKWIVREIELNLCTFHKMWGLS
jgi:hypothetical protein